jgi:hypothetical protein
MQNDRQGKESVVHFSKDDAAPYHRLWANSLEEKCRDLLESERTQTPTGNLLLPSGYYFVGAHNVDALKSALFLPPLGLFTCRQWSVDDFRWQIRGSSRLTAVGSTLNLQSPLASSSLRIYILLRFFHDMDGSCQSY